MSDGMTDAMREASKEQIINYELQRMKALIKEMQHSIEYIETELEEMQQTK